MYIQSFLDNQELNNNKYYKITFKRDQVNLLSAQLKSLTEQYRQLIKKADSEFILIQKFVSDSIKNKQDSDLLNYQKYKLVNLANLKKDAENTYSIAIIETSAS